MSETRHIVFTSLFGLTELYLPIARYLERKGGFAVYWISTNQVWTQFLVTSGVARSRILELVYGPSDFLSAVAKKALEREIVACERAGGMTINRVLMMDRFLMGRYRPDINEYIYRYYADIKRFLVENEVSDVFAEPTNTNDILTFMICRELGIRYLSPRDMRIPEKRMVFFEGFTQERVVSRTDDDGHQVDGRQLIDEFAERRPAPFYFERLKSAPVIQPSRIAKAVTRRIRQARVLRQRSLTHYDAAGRLRLTLKRSVNSLYLKHGFSYDRLDDITGRIAYYGLHVQPENSIDVLGPWVSDQLKLVKDIRRALPFDMTLVVKEHPNFLGMKSRAFFRELRTIPNIRILHHLVSSYDIYQRSDLVLTISGTSAYEAGLLGIPAVTFAPMYFGGLSSIRFCASPVELATVLDNLLTGFRRDFDADVGFMENLVRSSFDGYWTDPIFDRNVLEETNVAKVCDAFDRLLEHAYVR